MSKKTIKDIKNTNLFEFFIQKSKNSWLRLFATEYFIDNNYIIGIQLLSVAHTDHPLLNNNIKIFNTNALIPNNFAWEKENNKFIDYYFVHEEDFCYSLSEVSLSYNEMLKKIKQNIVKDIIE